MKLVSFSGGRAGLVEDGLVLDLTAAAERAGRGATLTVQELVGMGLGPALELVSAVRDEAPSCELAGMRLGPPVARPSKVIAAPINYRDHQDEMKQRYDVSGLGVFLKAPSSLIGHGDSIRLPYFDRRFDHEGELALVIGHRTAAVDTADALGSVFGYTCLLDITMRGGEDRSTRKSFDTFTPMGPWLVTADELGDPGDLDLSCSVNGEIRQKANTSELIWGVAELVSYASSVMTLEPGDVISTGTPAGVSEIVDGDQVVVTISSVGSLVVGVTAAGARACPTRGAEHGPVAPVRATPAG